MDFEIKPFDEAHHLNDAVRVYAQVWNRDYLESRQFIARYAQLPLFRGLVARVDRQVIGMTFGVRSDPGNWWHDRVAQQVGADHPALQQAWVLTELAVLPGYRDRGIGGALHDRVIRAQPLRHLLLSTQVSNRGAQRFYQRRGWAVLHPGFAFQPGRPPYLIMYRVLPAAFSR